jgi:microcystin-dependent protein
MVTFRDSGLELNVKADISEFSTPTGDRFTIFAVNSTSPSGRYYKEETGQQLWMVDSSGGMHEISNEWLEARVENTSAKLDYIYPAVTQFMSAGLLFLNSSTAQTISSDLNIIGNVSVSGATAFVSGTFEIGSDTVSTLNGPISAFADINAYADVNVNRLGTPDTMSNITPFFVRSSANRLHPAGWSDPALLVIGNTRIYDMFKPTDRGLRFTVMNRETFKILHDEVYDTAGSQHRVTDLAWKMFTLMNDTKNVGILNSREDWESLIWRKDTVESAGMSASDISAAYSNLVVGSLLDQFERFGLLKAIRAAGKHAEMYPDQAASQYCAMFEGSSIYVDTSGASAVIYPTNRAVESWVPRVSSSLPVSGEQMHAQLTGWFIQPRQLDITNNIADRSAAFVAFPYGRENDAIRETVYVNKDGLPAEFNARVSNVEVDVLKTTFSSPEGLWYLVGDVRVEADLVNITGAATRYVANTLDITGHATTVLADTLDVSGTATRLVASTLDVSGIATRLVASTLDVSGDATTLLANTIDITASTRHVGQIDMTDHKIVNLGLADIDAPQDAVNVEFTRLVTPVGAALDFGGTVAPSNWLMCQGDAATISGFNMLFNVIGFNYGMATSVVLSGNQYLLGAAETVVVSGVPMVQTDVIYDISGVGHVFTGVISGIGPYTFVSGSVNDVTGTPTFVPDGYISSQIDYFLLPAAQGRVSVGAGATTVLDISGNSVPYTYTLGSYGGADKHQLTVEESPSHAHTFNTYQDDYANPSGGQPPPGFMRDGTGTVTWTTTSVGGNKFHNIMQPHVVFNKIIRYK